MSGTGTLQDFWVIRDGIALYSREYGGSSAQLVTAFMSAISSFAKQIGGGGLRTMELGEVQYIFSEREGLLFVATYPREEKRSRVDEDLKKAIGAFFACFSQDKIEEFETSLDLSDLSESKEDFDEELKKSVQPLDTFWAALD
jgi:hypothetical protein